MLGACFRLTEKAGGVSRIGQNRTYTPSMTVNLVISLPKIPCKH